MKLGGWVIMFVVLSVFIGLIGIRIGGLDAIYTVVGVDINPTTSNITNVDVESSSFFSKLFGGNGILILLGVAGAGSLAIGLFGKGYDVSLVLAPLVVWVGTTFIVVGVSVISYVKDFNQAWMTSIVSILFIGLIVGFVFSCADYFGGR